MARARIIEDPQSLARITAMDPIQNKFVKGTNFDTKITTLINLAKESSPEKAKGYIESANKIVKEADKKVIIATYGVAAVGINIPRIFNLVLIEPGKSFVRVIQSIGRGIRKAEDKDFVQIWDLTSSCKYAKRHLTQRKKFYREAEYPFTMEKIDWS